MKKHRNSTVYVAQFANIKLHAFGIAMTLPFDCRVEIYQARVTPELWRGRPWFARLEHKWEAGTAEELQQLIAADFERCVVPWAEAAAAPIVRKRPSLFPENPNEQQRAG